MTIIDIGWGGEQNTIYKGGEGRRVLKPERESPKRIISTSGGSGPLQMVLESKENNIY